MNRTRLLLAAVTASAALIGPSAANAATSPQGQGQGQGQGNHSAMMPGGQVPSSGIGSAPMQTATTPQDDQLRAMLESQKRMLDQIRQMLDNIHQSQAELMKRIAGATP